MFLQIGGYQPGGPASLGAAAERTLSGAQNPVCSEVVKISSYCLNIKITKTVCVLFGHLSFILKN